MNKTKQASIAPLQPPTLAAFLPWGIKRELVVLTCRAKVILFWNKVHPKFLNFFKEIYQSEINLILPIR